MSRAVSFFRLVDRLFVVSVLVLFVLLILAQLGALPTAGNAGRWMIVVSAGAVAITRFLSRLAFLFYRVPSQSEQLRDNVVKGIRSDGRR